ncbi:glycoprotein Xg-like [Terrapene carolina triunguis]|uniref:glycoprotein Xg-like n=1 Tax=Terrapene triunguis TaxID=2587831 RepID=UPI000E77F352|nr:glycoprotein Xg-like [Terrapene carolina triunguis]
MENIKKAGVFNVYFASIVTRKNIYQDLQMPPFDVLKSVSVCIDFMVSLCLIEETITKKPSPATKRPVFDDHPKPHPRPPHKPQPGSYGNDDRFSDLDLNDGKPLPPRPAGEKESNVNHGGNTDSGVIAGVTSPVISVLVLLVVGTVAGYTAYKKKQLCFKANGDEKKGTSAYVLY